MNPLTFSEASAAQTRAFTKSPSGLARNNRFASDIQFAAAYLQRVGAGALTVDTSQNYLYITGPLMPAKTPYGAPVPWGNTTIEPLYLDVDITFSDSNGNSATFSLTYDMLYQDMTTVLTPSWGPPVTNTNVGPGDPIAAAGAAMIGYWPGGLPSSYTLSGGTSGSMTWTSGTYSATMTINLNTPKYWVDYAETCRLNLLDTITFNDELLNPSKTYPDSSGNHFQLRWLKDYPTPGTGPHLTNTLCASITRATGVIYSQRAAFGGLGNDVDQFLNWQQNPWNGDIFVAGGSVNNLKSILYGYGVPTNSNAPGPSVYIDHTGKLLTYAGSTSDGPCPGIVCAASCVRNSAAMGQLYHTEFFNQSTNAESSSVTTQSGLPSVGATTTFNYASVTLGGTGYGVIRCPYEILASTQPRIFNQSGYDYSMSPINPLYIGYGNSYTLYSIALASPYSEPICPIPATWSLVNITGSIVSGDLVPSADTTTAILTTAHHGTCQIQCAVSGLTPILSPVISV